MSSSILVVKEPIAQLVIGGDTPVTLQVVEETVAVVAVAEQGPSGPPGPNGSVAISRTALVVLSGQRVVIAAGEAGAAYPDIANPLDGELVLGVTLGAAQPGAAALIQVADEMIEGSWSWALGPVFCGPEGQLTQAPPPGAVWLRQVGVAVAPDRLLIQLRPPTLI